MNLYKHSLPAETEFRVPVATMEGIYFFPASDIIRLEASSNYTYIHFTNRKPLLIAKVLREYESLLSDFGFVRTHRSHLVNKKYIHFIDGAGNIVMQDASQAEISRRKKTEVMKALRGWPHEPAGPFIAGNTRSALNS